MRAKGGDMIDICSYIATTALIQCTIRGKRRELGPRLMYQDMRVFPSVQNGGIPKKRGHMWHIRIPSLTEDQHSMFTAYLVVATSTS